MLYFGRDWTPLIFDLSDDRINREFVDFTYKAQTLDSKLSNASSARGDRANYILAECITMIQPIQFGFLDFLQKRMPIPETLSQNEDEANEEYEQKIKILRGELKKFKTNMSNLVSEILTTFQSAGKVRGAFPEDVGTNIDMRTYRTGVIALLSNFQQLIYEGLTHRSSLESFLSYYKTSYTHLEPERFQALEIQKITKKLEKAKLDSEVQKFNYYEGKNQKPVQLQENQEEADSEIRRQEEFATEVEEDQKQEQAYVPTLTPKPEKLPNRRKLTVENQLNAYRNGMRVNHIDTPERAWAQHELAKLWNRSNSTAMEILAKMKDRRWVSAIRDGRSKKWYLVI